MTEHRPLPVPDDMSAPFWTAAGQHILMVARCRQCGRHALPPDVVCPHCGDSDLPMQFTAVSGRATVKSWTVVRQALLPGFAADVPFVLVDAELDDSPGLRLVGRLLDGPQSPLRIGAALHTAFEDIAPGVAIPAFELAE